MVACSLFLSFSNLMLPSWSTVDTTFNIPAEGKRKTNVRMTFRKMNEEISSSVIRNVFVLCE